jgi:cystathionine gamma-lyase
VVHSATKYLNGHSDVVAGLAVVGDNRELAEKLGYLQNAVGGVLDPFSSFLTLRGIRTLALRMERHSSNALALAEWLEQQPQVEKVWFPWLASHPHHQLARRQMALPGGMISVVVKGDDIYAQQVISRLKLFTLAESLGGVESLVSQPFSMTHASIPLEQRLANGITPQLIRLSVGIEDPQDLIADWQHALATEQIRRRNHAGHRRPADFHVGDLPDVCRCRSRWFGRRNVLWRGSTNPDRPHAGAPAFARTILK